VPVFSQFRRLIGGCVTEKPEIAEAGVEAVCGIDPAAIGLALSAASRDRADIFLEEQTREVAASKHFARAAQLDLTPSEKSELARFNSV
jgi:hypothetical protein